MGSEATGKRTLSEAELEKLRAAVRERTEHMSESDLRDILADEGKVETKLAALAGSVPGLAKNVKLGYSMVRDYVRGDYRKIPWWSVASVASALAYFLAPTDLIPDFIPLLGYLDDATVFAIVMAGIREDLKRYAEEKGLELPE